MKQDGGRMQNGRLRQTKQYPAADLRGIQFLTKFSSPLSKIPLIYGGDGGGPYPSPSRGEGRSFILPAELSGILTYSCKISIETGNGLKYPG